MKFVNLPSLCVGPATLQEASICVGGFGMSSLETYNKEKVCQEMSASVRARKKVIASLRSGSVLGTDKQLFNPELFLHIYFCR